MSGVPGPAEVPDTVDAGLALVIRDFCVLTIAPRVLAGSSAFAQVATRVGGGHLSTPIDLLGPATLESEILSFVRERAVDRFEPEVALACAHLLRVRRGLLGRDVRAEVLDALSRVDPEDPAPVLARAAMLVAEGRTHRAEELLAIALPGPRARALVRLLRVSRRIDKGIDIGVLSRAVMLTSDWDVIARSDPSTPWLSFVLGANDFGLTGSDDGRRRLLAAPRDLDDAAVRAAAEIAERSPDAPAKGGSVFRPSPEDLLGR